MSDWKERARAEVDRIGDQLREVAQELFDNPELKLEETHAAAVLTERARDAGFEVEVGVAGLETAFVASHPEISDGPTVAILAEYDALPEIGHACGHNLIAAGALGAAMAVGAVKKGLPGRLLLMGTPGEEGGGGKVTMVDQGLFEGVDAAMMYRPAPMTIVGHGSLAITEVKIEFHGRPAHASAWPEKGINALDAVIQTFNGLNALREHIKDGARIHGIISNGGAKPNIVPEYASAEFYVRAPETPYRDELLVKLRNCAEGAALATGATLEWSEVGHSYKSIKPNRPLVDAYVANLEALGWSLGAPVDAMGSTDMGDVTQAVPGIHPYLQICEPDIAAHTREFAEASSSERGFDVMLIAAKTLAMTAIDVLTTPALVERMWSSFRET